MLHIILLILKILGIILLAVIGLLLAILLIVLFVPIKYDVSLNYYDTPDIKVRVAWLFGGIKAVAEYNKKQFYARFSVFWKTIIDTKEEVKKVNEISENVLDDISDVFSDEEISEIELDLKPKNEEIKTDKSVVSEVKEPVSTPLLSSKEKQTRDVGTREKNQTLKKSFIDKIQIFLIKLTKKIRQIFERMIKVFEDIGKKSDSLSEKVDKIQRFIYAECTQNSIAFIKRMFCSTGRHMLPKKIQGNVHFGFDKPSLTGKILGYACTIYPLYGESIQLYPDFEKAVLEGDLKIQGSIRLYIFVYWGLRAVLCKDIRKLVKYIKHLKG